MIKINTSGDYVQLIYVDPVGQSVQQELKSDTDAFECSYDSEGKLYMQFGLMRFENPDPTDFTINGVAVTDAADFISKLNALFTGGGGGGGWGTTGTIATLTGDGTVGLNGHKILFDQGGSPFLALDATVNAESSRLSSKNNTGDGNISNLSLNTPADYAEYRIQSNFNDGTKTTEIFGYSDATESELEYTADTHQFNGVNEFADDAAAAAGGVPVNGLYHTAGSVKIRLS